MSPVVSSHAGFNFRGGSWDAEGEKLAAILGDGNDVFDSNASYFSLEFLAALEVEVRKVDVELIFGELSMEKEVSEVAPRLNGHAHTSFHNSGGSEVLKAWLRISFRCCVLSSSIKIASSIVGIEPNEMTKSMRLEHEAKSCLEHSVHIATDAAKLLETLEQHSL